jgi:acetoacetyl-CoA synthetase
VGLNYQDDQRVILFVKLAAGFALTSELKNKIRKTLRENASPRHVPAVILEAPEIPYTLNMKKVESAVTNILNGRAVSNRDALINPGSLEFYEGVVKQLGG